MNCSRIKHTFIPCHLEMALSGRRARSVLRDRKAEMSAASAAAAAKLAQDICKTFNVIDNTKYQVI